MEIEATTLAEGPDRDDVLDVLGCQIDHKHIDLISGIHFRGASSYGELPAGLLPVRADAGSLDCA
jgi:hypothetical protein